MNWNKNFLAFIIGQVFLVLLIGLWLRGVYHKEINSLKAETNVIFFNAIEEAKEKLFFNIHERDKNVTITSEFGFDVQDSAVKRKILVIEAGGRGGDSTHREHGISRRGNHASNRRPDNFPRRYVGDNVSAFMAVTDTTLNIDFDTTKSYLSNIFVTKIGEADLAKMQVKIIENPKKEAMSPGFRTDVGTLGNIFFGTNAYAASVEDFKTIIFGRMLPEIGISLVIFGSIFYAFLMLYKNLIKEQKLARLKDDFVSNISHELKTPISVVSVAIEALGNFDVIQNPNKAREYLDISRLELNRLSSLVDKVLNTASWEDGEVGLLLAPANPVMLMKDVMEVMCIKAGQLNADIQLDTKGDIPLIHIDAEKMKIVFYNLLDNAVKYGHQSPVNVLMYVENAVLITEVVNQGSPIPGEYEDQLFDKFFRVPNDNLHDVKGYGLGLYHVKKMVELHGGEVSLKSVDEMHTVAQLKIPYQA